MPKPHIDYDATRRLILVMMYDAFIRDQNMAFDVKRIRAMLPIPSNVIQVCLEKLETDDLITENGRQKTTSPATALARAVQEWQGFGTFELTENGRRHVEKLPDEAYDLSLASLGNGTATRVFQELPAPDLPPSPEGWEPLRIEVGDPQLKEVKGALDEVVRVVAQDNGYKATHPDERAEVLSAFSGATKLLEEASQVTYSSLVVYLVWPLDRLLSRFPTDSLVGAAGKVLKEALIAWVKSKIGGTLDDLFKGK